MKPLKPAQQGPPWWDKPLAIGLIIVFLAVLALFMMQYTGPTAP